MWPGEWDGQSTQAETVPRPDRGGHTGLAFQSGEKLKEGGEVEGRCLGGFQRGGGQLQPDRSEAGAGRWQGQGYGLAKGVGVRLSRYAAGEFGLDAGEQQPQTGQRGGAEQGQGGEEGLRLAARPTAGAEVRPVTAERLADGPGDGVQGAVG